MADLKLDGAKALPSQLALDPVPIPQQALATDANTSLAVPGASPSGEASSSTASSTDGPSASQEQLTPAATPKEDKKVPAEDLIKLGVCAMDRKARSKPMRNILSRLLATGKFEIIVFGDKVILDEEIENWPLCDFLISFFSSGFPLDKAISYVNLRKPVCVNDLPLQKVFWDRRVVLQMLDKIGVPTSKRLECNRDGGPQVDKKLADLIENSLGIRVDQPRKMDELEMKGDDAILINGKTLEKPFVEKPVSGEDHNVNIYFSKKKGGGARRLFRKVGNQSSAHDPNLIVPRLDGSYVYEQFIDVENSEDIKVYTLGPSFVHAESRKSPVVDGLVRRNTEGKEIRFICQLTDAEKKMARDISLAFKQNICGFDLLRAGGKSYVIDVNGWSFVKGNDFYYEKCAEILAKFCDKKKPSLPRTPRPAADDKSAIAQSWKLKCDITVFRHADRTPKCKLKFTFKSKDAWTKPFIDLLQGRTSEIILRDGDQMQYIADAANESLLLPDADIERLEQLKKVIEVKVNASGTKAQLKPSFDADGKCEKVQVVVKWGGEFTHAARYQSRDLGENFRKDVAIMNSNLFENTNVYSSSERRVVATAEIFSTAFLEDKVKSTNNVHPLIIRKDLLDDSNAAKEEMDKVKKQLKSLCRPGEHARPEFNWASADQQPFEVVKETIELMRYNREVLNENWGILDIENIQARWCCGEYPYLFKERWEALFRDWCDVELEKFDPSRVSELYDSLKYDALHNRTFLEAIFTKGVKPATPSRPSSIDSRTSEKTVEDRVPKKLRELYKRAKWLFDLIAPQEYGIERSEKKDIGLLTSLPLLEQIVGDLSKSTNSEGGFASFYFTKESHIHTLVNLVTLSDLPIVMPHVPELDYMAYISFEVYERLKGEKKEYSVKITLSEGAHSPVLDASLDAKHALQVQPRRALTGYIDLEEAIAILKRHSKDANERLLKKSTTPLEGFLPIEGDEVYKGATRRLEEIRQFKIKRPRSLYSNASDVE